MKKTIILTLIMSASFCQGVLYMDLGLSPKYEASFMGLSIEEDLDTGSISIGYYHPVYVVGNMGMSIGGSYEVIPATSDEDIEFGFMALYGAGFYSLGNGISAWCSLGVSIPTSDDFTDEDAENGSHMGLGVSYPVNNQIEVALGYVTNSTSVDDMDWTFSKMILSVGYKL